MGLIQRKEQDGDDLFDGIEVIERTDSPEGETVEKVDLVGGSLGTVGTVMGIIAAIMLGIAIVFPAYSYACSKGKTWRIICIIVFIVYFVLAILGSAAPLF